MAVEEEDSELPTLTPLAISTGDPLDDILSNLVTAIQSVGNSEIEQKKIEKSNMRFEWVTDKGKLRGVQWRMRKGRASVKYIGKGRTLKERHQEYDRYAKIYEEEKEGLREKRRY